MKMFADQTGGIDVKNQNIASSLNSFINTNYSNDIIAENLNNAGLLSTDELQSSRYYLPSTDRSYWLSNTGGSYGLSYRAYATSSNVLENNSLELSGTFNGRDFGYNASFADGPFAWTCNAQLEKLKVSGWRFNPSSKSSINWYVRRASNAIFNSGDEVWNNPYLLSSGSDGSFKYVKTYTNTMINDYNRRFYGVYRNGIIVPATSVTNISKGEVVVYGFYVRDKQLRNSSNFLTSADTWLGFLKCRNNVTVYPYSIDSRYLTGVVNGSVDQTGTTVREETKAIRPSATLNSSNIAFFRNSTSSSVSASATLGSTPVQNANRGSSYKAAVKDSSMSVSAALTSANFGTDRGNVRIEGTTVHVPYGAKTLTINNVNRNGGNYLSALSSTQGARQYGILGNSNTVKIDLTNLLSVNVLGSETTISLFSEQINGSGTSDKISANPFSFKIRISEAVPFKLTYDADGGSGTSLPATSEVKSGTSISLADGSLLQKEGNSFSRWLVTYKLSDEIYTTKLLMNSAQLFTMPYADVTVTALYSGISTGKDSRTEGQEKYLVTFDPNGGFWGTSTNPIAVPIVPGNECPDPGRPTRDGYTFLGWYNRPEGGQRIDLKKVVFTGHTSLYAHWFKNDQLVFLAPKDTDPTKVISGEGEIDLIGIGDVKVVATTLSTEGNNPDSDVYNATNDAWHLFAKISGDGSNANDWLESRIIHTGQHDGDGSGLTFQAVHALTSQYMWDSKWSFGQSAPNWENCTLRSTMNNSIFNSLPSGLQNAILPVTKKYNTKGASRPNGGSSASVTDKLWLISTTELVRNVAAKDSLNWSDNSHQGSTYAFWNNFDLPLGQILDMGSTPRRLIYAMNCNRSGTLLSWDCMWLRSLPPVYQEGVMRVRSHGFIDYYYPEGTYCVSPCFSL